MLRFTCTFCIAIVKLTSMSVFGASNAAIQRSGKSIYQANLCFDFDKPSCKHGDGQLSTKLTLNDYFADHKRSIMSYPEEQKFPPINEHLLASHAPWFRNVAENEGRANWVDSFSRPSAFIASMAPVKDEHVDDFLRMIWENNVRVIVMLVPVSQYDFEGIKYWPAMLQPSLDFGQFNVHLQSFYNQPGYQCTRVELTKRKERRLVTHCQFLNWPDMSIPASTDELLHFRRHVAFLASEAAKEDAEPSPILVHCMAGWGRTGTYIAIDVLIERMDNMAGEPVDLAGVVRRLRVQRPRAVLTKDQYDFCVTALSRSRASNPNPPQTAGVHEQSKPLREHYYVRK